MNFPYPELSNMSASASTSADCKSPFLVIKTRTSIKTNGITKGIGANNYNTWEIQVEYLFISIDTKDIVLENL
jgi:hypothetical protein